MIRQLLLIIALAMVITVQGFVVAPFDENLIVNTHQGRIQGVFDPITAGHSLSWKGIPYAAPPARFQPPQPPANRGDTVLKTFNYASPCLQKRNLQDGESPSAPRLIGSEDCLYLNVWVPGTARTYNFKRTSTDRLPVVIAFHDGRQASGSGSDDAIIGNIFTANHKEAIWVSFNYRLGPWGYLALSGLTNEQGFSGAYGALDQLMAVKWVKNNIKFFGGNPDKIMLYGVGGGGVGVSTLLASASATGLFKSVLIESPYVLWQKPLANLEAQHASAVTTGLNCIAYVNQVDCVRNVTNEELCDILYQAPLGAPPTNQLNGHWHPAFFDQHHFIVPIGGFLPDSILNILKNDPPNREVTVLIGGSEKESAWLNIVNASNTGFTYAQTRYFARNFISNNFPFQSANTTALDLATEALLAAYGSPNYDQLVSDGSYTCSIVAMLNCSRLGGSENWYQYHINRSSPLNNYVPHHAAGNPYWTQNMHVDKYANHRIPDGDDFCVQRILTNFLTNAARTTNPNISPIDNINEIQFWPKWNLDHKRHLYVQHCPTNTNKVPFSAYERCRTLWFNPFSLIA